MTRALVPSSLVLLVLLAACAGAPSRRDAAPAPARPDVGVLPPEARTLVVEQSLRVEPGTWLRRPLGPDGRDGVIRLEGLSDVTLDLTGVELRGNARGVDPDRHAGWGVVVTGCDGVVIKGGTLGGYRACLVIEDSHDVVVEGTRFDGWHAQRLLGTAVAEDPADELDVRADDGDDWLERYGAAIAVRDASRVVVRGARGRHGQNGILLVRSGACELVDNDFSFLSGWGLALYRSSGNTVSRNRFDWCVRGFAHERYALGQGSAGILLGERSARNAIVRNSATHCGHGIRVYGGLDLEAGRAYARGEADPDGANGNRIVGNDVSFAVAGGIEIAFADDTTVALNEVTGCRGAGVHARYAGASVLARNTIHDVAGPAVALEHAQEWLVADNDVLGCDIGIALTWSEDAAIVEGVYGAHRDTSSRDHRLVGNRLEENVQDLVLRRTAGVLVRDNTWSAQHVRAYVDRLECADGPVGDDERLVDRLCGPDGSRPTGNLSHSSLRAPRAPTAEELTALAAARSFEVPEGPGSQAVRLVERGLLAGPATIVLGEWGPWDHPSGEPRPRQRRPGGLLADASWDAAWFRWSPETDPRGDLETWRALKYAPLVRRQIDAWVHPWGEDGLRETIGATRFGLVAHAELAVRRSGLYRLKAVSDDGVRVLLDGECVLEDWTWHPPRLVEVEIPIRAGTHRFDLEYFQIEGAAALALDLELVGEP